MTHQPPFDTGRQHHGDTLWAHAREAYSCGASATDVCGHYGLSLSTFRKRARREGWRRGDLSEDPGGYHASDHVVHETLDAEAMSERAWRAASEAVRLGRLSQAQGWTRLSIDLRALAEREREARERHDGGARSPVATRAAVCAAVRREALMAPMAPVSAVPPTLASPVEETRPAMPEDKA